MNDRDDGFLSRWARRKALAREGKVAEPPAPVVDTAPAVPPQPVAETPPPQDATPVAEPPPAEPPPTLEDVAALTRESSFGRFVRPDVDPTVRNAALRKLFADPHFNVMDGLDIYIDDYSRPDPLPASMLRQMVQAHALGLFADEDKKKAEATVTARADMPDAAAPAPAADPAGDACAPEPEPHEDTDLRLQPHDAAGCAGAEPGLGPHDGGER